MFGRKAKVFTIARDNPLEKALQALSANALSLQVFYKALGESTVFVVNGNSDNSSRRQDNDDGNMLLRPICVEIQGEPHIAVFSSVEAIEEVIPSECNYVAVAGRDLLESTRGAFLIVDPDTARSRRIFPSEVDAILNVTLGQQSATAVVPDDESVLFAQPSNVPTELTQALASVLESYAGVQGAYLGVTLRPASMEQHLVIGIENDGDWDSLMRDISFAIKTTKRPDMPIDIVRMDDSDLATYLRGTAAFDTRRVNH